MNFQTSALGALSRVFLIAVTLLGSHMAEASALLSDDFNSGTTTEGANPTWVTSAGATLDGVSNALIDVPAGQAHDLTINNNTAPRILQSAPNTDFNFEVKFETEPTLGIQIQGIIIQGDDNSFLRFDIFHDGGAGVKLYVAHTGTDGVTLHSPIIGLANFPKYRQVKRVGDDWTFRYSTTGAGGSWTDVNFTQAMTVSKVGFYAGNAGNNPQFLSSVDYFIDLDDHTRAIDVDTWVPPTSSAPVIDTWYANPIIKFGHAGIPQKWANILGNVSSDTNIATLSYKVNNSTPQPLYFAKPNKFDYRLENEGDFNIEIDRASLDAINLNTVEIKATDSEGRVTTKSVNIDYNSQVISAPSLYTVNWSSAQSIQEVDNIAHIVDGLWELTADGIRTTEPGYDRAIAVGDMSWQTDDREVTVSFIPHGAFTGIGFAVGWQGHTVHASKDISPRVGWPAQAVGWVTRFNNPKLQIIGYNKDVAPSNWENRYTEKSVPKLIAGQTYMLKSYSQALGNGMSKFHMKFWKEGQAEPTGWDINANVPTRNGSVLLLAYDGDDVTFGNVTIKDVSTNPPGGDTTAPVISDINVTTTGSTATVTWETDEPSHSVVKFGMNTINDSTATDSALTETHSLTLTDLSSAGDYRFVVKSTDASGNTATSDEGTFNVSVATGSTYQLPHNQWHQISLPLNPGSSNKVSDVFGDDGLGTYGDDWILFSFDGSSNGYIELGLNDTLSQGMGYWIIQITGDSKTLDMPAGSTEIVTTVFQTGNYVEIPLATAGTNQWNMVGYPFDAQGQLNNARIKTTVAPCGLGCTMADAETNNISQNRLWAYSASANKYVEVYTANGNLNPWQGFWIATLAAANGKSPSLLFSKP